MKSFYEYYVCIGQFDTYLFQHNLDKIGFSMSQIWKYCMREAFKKKDKKCGFFPPPLDPPPLKCGNTFCGKNFFLQFHPENDLPTHKNWMK